jgi:excisionase family DNA binding protein
MTDTSTRVARLLDSREVASRFGIKVETFRRLCARGLGPPHVLVGDRRRFPEDELRAWVQAHLVRGGGSSDARVVP